MSPDQAVGEHPPLPGGYGFVSHPQGTVTVVLTIPPAEGETAESVGSFLAGVLPAGWMIEIRSH